jgi:rhodanese-related sulfurtransferase
LKALLEGPDKPPLFDARPRASYEAGHLPGAISLGVDELDQRAAEVPRDRLSVYYCSGKT